MKAFLSVLTLLIFFTGDCRSGNHNTAQNGFITYMQAKAEEFKKMNGIKGMAVVLFTGDEIIWKKTFGRSTYGFAVNDSTMFGLQSISKNLTALAVMLAVEDGVLDLDAPITDYLQGFTVNSCFDEKPEDKITLRMLLSHTCGLPHEAPVGNNYDFSFSSIEEHLESISESWLRFPPGNAYYYSNLGYDLAAQIIESSYGIDFPEYMEKRLFQPLGMKNSTLEDKVFVNALNKTEGTMNAVKVKHYPIPLIGSGAVYSSLNDMVKYVQMHLNNGIHGNSRFAESNSLQAMYRVVSNNYGLGTYTDSLEGSYYLNHNGGGFGYGASMLWFPEYNIGCVVLSNKPANCFELASSVISQYLLANNPGKEKDTLRTSGNHPFIGVEKDVDGSAMIYCKRDSVYKAEWEGYPGVYEVVFGGMEYKWYARLSFAMGYKPNKLLVIRKGDELWLEGSFGESKLYEYLPGLFFTQGGAALDLRNTPGTFNNLALKKYR
jgi:CubicO group peptidase (beta-lactamase class C family)